MGHTSSLATRQDIASATRLDRILETLLDISVDEVAPHQCAMAASTCCSAIIKINNQYSFLLIINCTDNALQIMHEKSSYLDGYGIELDFATDTLQFLTDYTAKQFGGLLTTQDMRTPPTFSETESDGIVIDKYYNCDGYGIHLIMAEMMGVVDPT